MELYLSKNNSNLNGKPLDHEDFCDHICLSPYYRIKTLRRLVKVMLDSGAFQDHDRAAKGKVKAKRLSFDEALGRQLKYEEKVGFVSHRLVAYDLMGDGLETVAANFWLAQRRQLLAPRQLVLMTQGNTREEYLDCLARTLEFAQPEDCIGFGGVAKAGTVGALGEKLLDAIIYGSPMIAAKGIKEIHIFGVGTIRMLKRVGNAMDCLVMDDKVPFRLQLSTDTSAFEVNSVNGRVLNAETGMWVKTYTKEQKKAEDGYHPADLTIHNMKTAIDVIGRI